MVGIAIRANSQKWKTDWVVRSLIVTDICILLMSCSNCRNKPKLQGTFSRFDRTKSVPLVEQPRFAALLQRA